MHKVVVDYDHDPADLSPIYLAVTDSARPATWKPALRDMIGNRKVVWARFPRQSGRMVTVWVRDHNGARAVTSVRL